jgi:Telomeric single stranded DNA binding POT1/CDC13
LVKDSPSPPKEDVTDNDGWMEEEQPLLERMNTPAEAQETLENEPRLSLDATDLATSMPLVGETPQESTLPTLTPAGPTEDEIDAHTQQMFEAMSGDTEPDDDLYREPTPPRQTGKPKSVQFSPTVEVIQQGPGSPLPMLEPLQPEALTILEQPPSSEVIHSATELAAMPVDEEVDQMPPPALPPLKTSSAPSSLMAPPSALPTSPKTPEIHPLQSTTLPLPSPFPGDHLSNPYADAFSRPAPLDFTTPPKQSPTGIAPDSVFHFGFGFGFGGPREAPETAREEKGILREEVSHAEADNTQPVPEPSVKLVSSGAPADAQFSDTAKAVSPEPAIRKPSPMLESKQQIWCPDKPMVFSAEELEVDQTDQRGVNEEGQADQPEVTPEAKKQLWTHDKPIQFASINQREKLAEPAAESEEGEEDAPTSASEATEASTEESEDDIKDQVKQYLDDEAEEGDESEDEESEVDDDVMDEIPESDGYDGGDSGRSDERGGSEDEERYYYGEDDEEEQQQHGRVLPKSSVPEVIDLISDSDEKASDSGSASGSELEAQDDMDLVQEDENQDMVSEEYGGYEDEDAEMESDFQGFDDESNASQAGEPSEDAEESEEELFRAKQPYFSDGANDEFEPENTEGQYPLRSASATPLPERKEGGQSQGAGISISPEVAPSVNTQRPISSELTAQPAEGGVSDTDIIAEEAMEIDQENLADTGQERVPPGAVEMPTSEPLVEVDTPAAKQPPPSSTRSTMIVDVDSSEHESEKEPESAPRKSSDEDTYVPSQALDQESHISPHESRRELPFIEQRAHDVQDQLRPASHESTQQVASFRRPKYWKPGKLFVADSFEGLAEIAGSVSTQPLSGPSSVKSVQTDITTNARAEHDLHQIAEEPPVAVEYPALPDVEVPPAPFKHVQPVIAHTSSSPVRSYNSDEIDSFFSLSKQPISKEKGQQDAQQEPVEVIMREEDMEGAQFEEPDYPVEDEDTAIYYLPSSLTPADAEPLATAPDVSEKELSHPTDTARTPPSVFESNLPITPEATQTDGAGKDSSFTMPPALQQSVLPPTPQMTQGTFTGSFTTVSESFSGKAQEVTAEEHIVSQPSAAMAQEDDRDTSQAGIDHALPAIEAQETFQGADKTLQPSPSPSRSFLQRASELPAALSTWFSPRRTTKTPQKSPATSRSQVDHVEKEQVTPTQESFSFRAAVPVAELKEPLIQQPEDHASNGIGDGPLTDEEAEAQLLGELRSQPLATSSQQTNEKEEQFFLRRVRAHLLSETPTVKSNKAQQHIVGFRTALSYYTPVAALPNYLNSSSPFDQSADILAIVSKASAAPKRADKGPRDYFTQFSIVDRTLTEPDSKHEVRVQVFRPWKAALPKAEVGDVVLLRQFEVLGARGGIGVSLRSGEDSAWCVWRFNKPSRVPEQASQNKYWDAEHHKPIWATTADEEGRSSQADERSLVEREEVNGPPVEIGKEEREHVDELRHWWQDAKAAAVQAVDAPDNEGYENGEYGNGTD